jgi:hypothetical protein
MPRTKKKKKKKKEEEEEKNLVNITKYTDKDEGID